MLSHLSLLLVCALMVGMTQGYRMRPTSNPTICDPNVKQYAGLFEIDPTTQKNYFYWAFESRSNPATDPVVLWMTGGPGCSSEVALFNENGPCRVNADGATTTNNTYSWNTAANMIYIDQPAGVGFSTASLSGYDSNEAGVARDMYAFLQDFFKAHPEWQNNEFYIFAESYGGHYGPATAAYINTMNQNATLKINLKGIGIGNGLTDPEIQFSYYAQLAYNYSIQKTGKPSVSLQAYELMSALAPACIDLIKGCNSNSSLDPVWCLNAQVMCEYSQLMPYQFTGMNPYDIRLKCEVPPLCYNMSSINTYLNTPAIQQALGVSGNWQSCNQVINLLFSFAGDWMTNYQQDLPALLANDIRVLIYAGDCDFICNWLGNKAWTLALPWPGQAAFNNASDVAYWVGGKPAGELRTANGFSFLRVYDAGHMVPFDQPQVALHLFNDFVHPGGKMHA